MPLPIPSVNITVADNGASAALVVPLPNVQVVIGCAVGGSTNVPIATTNPATLVNQFTGGPLVEAAGMVCQAGNVAIAIAVPIVTKGSTTSVVATTPGGGTSVVTVTLDGTNGAWDSYYVKTKVVTSGTIGTSAAIQISLDAGRNYGPIIALGTATTYLIPNTGITLNFGVGTLVAGDSYQFSTTGPAWNDAGIQGALNALAASSYAISGWGSLHIVGLTAAGDVTNFQTYLTTLANEFIFTRALTECRDALAPTAWGGSGESESTWMTSIENAFSASSARRVLVGAGYYNMPSPFPNAAGGTPSYRRPLTWAQAVRRTQIPLQRRAGRVKDGALANITINPASDPGDGFIYHDERINPGLNSGRLMAAQTYAKQQGFFVTQENLMSPNGSQFLELVLGNVVDVACDIGYATGVEELSDDLRLQANGTLYPTDALQLQTTINNALAAGMTNVAMVSSATATVDQSANVASTGNVPVTINVAPRGYVNTVTETVSLAAP
jgi:hypothetical protein